MTKKTSQGSKHASVIFPLLKGVSWFGAIAMQVDTYLKTYSQPDIKKEFKEATYTLKYTQKGLTFIIKTQHIGKLEMKLLKVHGQNNNYRLRKIDYYTAQGMKYSLI